MAVDRQGRQIALRADIEAANVIRQGITHPRMAVRWSIHSTLTAARAYLDLLKGLCLIQWDALGKPEGVLLVGVLRERWDQELKAARGSASTSMRKAVAQGAELDALQKAHVKVVRQLRLVNTERDELKVLLRMVAPFAWEAWIEEKKRERTIATDIPQPHATNGD